MQLLVSLGVWPEGIWREQPSHQHKKRFHGRMYKVGDFFPRRQLSIEI